MSPVISVENLSKVYRLGQIGGRTLSEDLNRWWAKMRGKPNPYLKIGQEDRGNPQGEYIWALKDVSFTVDQGEVVGIIGRNGAGKSTLLKIMSRVTAPTSGQVKVKGRVASLLEVGTGFHPELTGRENIYLNGAILGMSRTEVDHKFEEIVAFAELEKFIDTPVKRYSSGMYVRLAFAVAAHLEPEILLVDEVLAVGDAAFQKKCLGKMGDVAKEGRTVIFVSHNMQAIQSLCGNAFQLESGQVVTDGDARSVVAKYLLSISGVGSEATWSEQTAPGNDEVKLTAIRIHSGDDNVCGTYSSKNNLYVELEFIANTKNPALCIGFDLITSEGATVLRSYQTDLPSKDWPPIRIGKNYWYCTIPGSILNAGTYYLCPRIGMHNMYWIVSLHGIVQFEIILDHGVSPLWNSLNERSRPGVIAPILNWNAGKR